MGKSIAYESRARLIYIQTRQLARLDVWGKRRLMHVAVDAANALEPSVIFIDEVETSLSDVLNEMLERRGCHELRSLLKADWHCGRGDDVTFITATNKPHLLHENTLLKLYRHCYGASAFCYYMPSPNQSALEIGLPNGLSKIANTDEESPGGAVNNTTNKSRQTASSNTASADTCVSHNRFGDLKDEQSHG